MKSEANHMWWRWTNNDDWHATWASAALVASVADGSHWLFGAGSTLGSLLSFMHTDVGVAYASYAGFIGASRRHMTRYSTLWWCLEGYGGDFYWLGYASGVLSSISMQRDGADELNALEKAD